VKRALVVGAGIGGLAAAAGWHAKVSKSTSWRSSPTPRLSAWASTSRQRLAGAGHLGVLDQVLATGFPFGGAEQRDLQDNRIAYMPSKLGDDRVPGNVGLTARRLSTILRGAAVRAGAQIRYATTVTDLAESPDDVIVMFSDGGSRRYDVVAAFDGVSSAMRRRLFGDAYEPVFMGAGCGASKCRERNPLLISWAIKEIASRPDSSQWPMT